MGETLAKSAKPYEMEPSAVALNDQSVQNMRSAELHKRSELLSFQLCRAFDVDSLLGDLWDDVAVDAWRTVARHAGGMLQQALIRELLLLSFHLVDETKSSSSIANCHKVCFAPHLETGPFKKYYLRLYQDLKKAGAMIDPLRHYLVAHQDREWLQGKLWVNLRNSKNEKTDGSFSFGELRDFLVLCSYYVNLTRMVSGNSPRKFRRKSSLDGAEDLKAALNAYASAKKDSDGA
jgi:hypothetical protein